MSHWPGVSDYQEAIQAPQLCFGDPDLKAGSPVLTKLGLPRPISGGNASVYQLRSGKHEWAVRCFLRDLPDLQKRYEAIDKHLRTTKLPKVGFQYLKDGIRVRGRWVPILKMEWVRGLPINEHIKSLLADPKALRRLAEEWAQLMTLLVKERVAHGDLQHGNVMVARDKLVLIDYDGMYVPELHGNPSHELGHASYQHPRRQPADFGPAMDRFSALLFHTAILALSVKPELWAKHDNADNLLFEREDLEAPDQSALFDALEQLPDEDVAAQASALRLACSEPIDQVPEIADAVKFGKKAQKRLTKQKNKKAAAPAAPSPTPAPAPAPVAAPKPAPAVTRAAAMKRATQALGGPTPSWVSARVATPPASFGLVQTWQHTRQSTGGQLATPAKPAGSMLLSLISLGVFGANRRRKQQALVRPGGRPSAGTGRSPAIKSLAFSLDGRLLLAGGDDRFCDVYDAKTGKQLRRLGPHTRAVTGVVAAGSDRFATCSLDGRVRVFSTKGNLLGSWPGARKTPFFAAASTPDGELLAFGMGRIVKVFANNGQHKATMRGHNGEVIAVALTRSKQHVISGSLDRTVRIWSVGNARCEHELAGLHDAVEAVAVSDDCTLVAGSTRDGMVCIWDGKTSSPLHRIDTQQHGVHALAFMPGSRTLLAAGADGVIHFIDAGNGTITGKVLGHQGAVFGLAVTPDGSAIASSSADGSISGWSQKARTTATPKTPAPQLAGRP